MLSSYCKRSGVKNGPWGFVQTYMFFADWLLVRGSVRIVIKVRLDFSARITLLSHLFELSKYV